MKSLRKIMALLIAMVMVIGMSMSVFAGTIELQSVVDNEVYDAYKILNYTQNGNAVSYYLTSEEYSTIGSVLKEAGISFTATSDGTQYFVNNSEALSESGVSDVAAYLGAHVSELGNALGHYQATGSNGSASFTGLGTGYYFVTSTTGSLCALHNEKDIATAVEKNTVPHEDKKQSKTDGDYSDAQLDMNIGDTVYYQVEITDGKATDQAITLVDTMDAGLTFNQDSIAVTKNGDTVDADKYEVSGKTDQGFTLKLKAAYVATLNENDVVIVKYNATINENAVINDAINNTATLTYSNQTTTDTTTVKTYDFTVFKTDGTNFLDGAEFKLYDAATDGNQILLSSDDIGYYVDAEGSEDTTIDINSDSGCNVRGLKPGTYYLEEVVVPDGYNKLEERKAVTVTSTQTEAVEITVVNNAGSVLPSTGGIGTTIFYIVGGILVAGAAIILIAKRKVKA